MSQYLNYIGISDTKKAYYQLSQAELIEFALQNLKAN